MFLLLTCEYVVPGRVVLLLLTTGNPAVTHPVRPAHTTRLFLTVGITTRTIRKGKGRLSGMIEGCHIGMSIVKHIAHMALTDLAGDLGHLLIAESHDCQHQVDQVEGPKENDDNKENNVNRASNGNNLQQHKIR